MSRPPKRGFQNALRTIKLPNCEEAKIYRVEFPATSVIRMPPKPLRQRTPFTTPMPESLAAAPSYPAAGPGPCYLTTRRPPNEI